MVFGKGWRENAHWNVDKHELAIDLLPWFPRGPQMRARAFISDGDGTEHDRHHAERIGITEITLVPGASHSGLGKLMRDNGMMHRLIVEDRNE